MKSILAASAVALAITTPIAGVATQAASPVDPVYSLGKVRGPGSLPFLWDDNSEKGCPNESAKCLTRGYSVPGAVLILGDRKGRYIYAFDPNRSWEGWVRADRLSVTPVSANPPLSAWQGHWWDGDNNIKISVKSGVLVAFGNSYWPSRYPSRSAFPSGPRYSGMEDEAKPTGNRVIFRQSDDENPCRIDIALVGSWLKVGDNHQCGVLTAWFPGIYHRK